MLEQVLGVRRRIRPRGRPARSRAPTTSSPRWICSMRWSASHCWLPTDHRADPVLDAGDHPPVRRRTTRATGEADDVRTAHARYFAGREADVLALWDSPRQREAYDWLDNRTGEPARRIPVGCRPATISTPQPPSPSTQRSSAYWIEQYEPIGWAEELIEPARAADHRRLRSSTRWPTQCYVTGRLDEAIGYAEAGRLRHRKRPRIAAGAVRDIRACLVAVYSVGRSARTWVELCREVARAGSGTRLLFSPRVPRSWRWSTVRPDRRSDGDLGGPARDRRGDTDNPHIASYALLAYGFAHHDARPPRGVSHPRRA